MIASVSSIDYDGIIEGTHGSKVKADSGALGTSQWRVFNLHR